MAVRAAVNNRSSINLTKKTAGCVRFTAQRSTDLGKRDENHLQIALSLVWIALGGMKSIYRVFGASIPPSATRSFHEIHAPHIFACFLLFVCSVPEAQFLHEICWVEPSAKIAHRRG